jgi:tyrosinase
MINETATLALGTDYTNFRRLEINPHDWAHNTTGSRTGDWLREVGTSVRDPLFFLIHCNADRLWARWQWANNRYDAQNVTTYSPQGTFAGAGTIHIGHYLNDSMWPWNGVIGTYTGTGTVLIGNRPNNAPGGPVPNALSLASPVNIPRPLNMIDYRNNRLLTTINSGMGFSYDDTPFQ